MPFSFTVLASGSRGNATLIRAGNTHVLVDCGLGIRQLSARLGERGVEPESLDAVIVTHEHADHLAGVAALARRHHVPVWLTAGTRAAWRHAPQPQDGAEVHSLSPHQPLTIGDLQIEPYPVPHDAREPCQYVFSDGAKRLGMLSDAGCVTPHMRSCLNACDALLLEFNHDTQMLQDGPYPDALKRRVLSRYGHLSNTQAAELLGEMDCSRLQHLVAIHLSEKNNRPDLALAAAAGALGCTPDWLSCATQDTGLDWRAVH